jgi:hypothetical protein
MCSGCAIIPFSVSRTLPDPIQKVEVLKEETGQPVENPEVVMYAERFKNWTRSFPPHYTAAYIPPTQASVVVPLQGTTHGSFIPEKRRVRRAIRPWGIGPLGTTIYEDYSLTVSARAAGRIPVTARYWPDGGLNPMLGATGTFKFPIFRTNGIMTVYLRATNAEPSGAANGSQPIRSETNFTPLAAGSRR